MPIAIEFFPQDSIMVATFNEPFAADQDMPVLFAELIRFRLAQQGTIALILDLRAVLSSPRSFSDMVFSLAHASDGIKAEQLAGVSGPPMIIFVGAGLIAYLTAQSIDQKQYGGAQAHLCDTREEAFALARTKRST